MTITLPERHSISRKRWRQIEHIAQFANAATAQGYTVDGLTGALRGITSARRDFSEPYLTELLEDLEDC